MVNIRVPKQPVQKLGLWPPKAYRALRLVRDEDTWSTIANDYGISASQLIYFNFRTLVPEEINWYLRELIGCKSTGPKGRNYSFRGADPAKRRLYIPLPSAVEDKGEVSEDTETLTAKARNLNENLIISKATVKRVKSVMHLGAANKGYDLVVHTVGWWTTDAGECLLQVRKDQENYKKSNPSRLAFIKYNASLATKAGCGNCDEQAMIAFTLLYNMRIRPLDLMYAVNGEHVFVVIGRDKTSRAMDHGRWGRNAVICDPWGDASYPAGDIMRKLPSGRTRKPLSKVWYPSSWYRAD